MNILRKNFSDVFSAVIPIVILVLVASFFIVETPGNLIVNFLIGSVFLIVGLAIFMTGISVGVEKIARKLGELVQYIKKPYIVVLFGFLLGFIITIAEPNLMVLGKSIEEIVGINRYVMVVTISLGFGLITGFGILRILKDFSIRKFFFIIYTITFIVFFTQPNLIRNISFEASSASTGAMTTPFVLALAYGVSSLKGSDRGEKDSFGMVGIASSGPVLAVLILGILMNTKNLGMANLEETQTFIEILFGSIKESALAIAPVAVLFYFFNGIKLKLPKDNVRVISFGLLYSFIGLSLFLTGVYMGFLDLAFHLGKEIFLKSKILFLIFGFITGMLVVLAEPSVHAMIEQVEDVTSGSVDKKFLRIALSFGVGFAILLSGLRITIPGMQLWMYLFPGFLLALILSTKVDPLFVGVSFDAGGVASGPMTATFILSLMQGAASVSTVGDKVVNGFGVIASVAVAPIVSMMILGLLYSKRS